MRRRTEVRRRGMTLVLVTTIGVIVGILGLSMATLGYESRILAVRNVQQMSARTAADAGLTYAVFLLEKDLEQYHVNLQSTPGLAWADPTAGWTTPVLLGPNATYHYRISRATGADVVSSYLNNDTHPQYKVESTGACGLSQRTVHATVVTSSRWLGIGVKGRVDVKKSAKLTVVNGTQMQIQSNTTDGSPAGMSFATGVNVPGDIICGPGVSDEDLDRVIDYKGSIQADFSSASTRLDFPDVVWATSGLPASLGTLSTDKTLTGGTYVYDKIAYGSANRTLTISGPTTLYVSGVHGVAVDLGNSGQIVINNTGSLTLYLNGNLEAGNSVGILNDTDNAQLLKIYGTPNCAVINLKAKATAGSSDLYASVYAPEADVTLYNSSYMQGAVVANNFIIDNSANYCFDASLAQVGITDQAAKFIIGRWWE